MKIRDVFSLIREFTVFSNSNDYALYSEHDLLCHSRRLEHISYARKSDTEYELRLSGCEEDNVFHLVKKEGLAPIDELMIKNIVNAINRSINVLSFNELYMALQYVQLDTLLQGIGSGEDAAHAGVLSGETRKILVNHIMKMDEWAAQTYENNKISFALGIDLQSGAESDIHIYDIYNDAMLKVLSSSHDSILVCNGAGGILQYERLEKSFNANTPLIYSKFAQWSRGRLAVILSMLGEILIFYDQRFLYLKRSGKWYPADTSPLQKKMRDACGYNSAMKSALINTCYDVSFKRCGACIGIVDKDCPLVYDIDRYQISATPRAAFFRRILGKKKFQDIDRELRAELAAIDGATVLDMEGNMLAVGAILKINTSDMGERTTGGRSVAARQLAEYGIGIKISADGSIEAWHKNPSGILEKFIEVL